MKRFTTTTAIASLVFGLAAAPALADGHDEKKKHKDMVKSKANVSFESVDANGDMTLDFTEFSNHFEKYHGWSAADSAVAYTKIANDMGVVTKDAFMNMSMDKSAMMDTMTTTSTGTSVKMAPMETTTTTTTVETSTVVGTSEPVMQETTTTRTTSHGSGSLIGLGTSMTYGTFADYDANNDGMVSFSEYSRIRSNTGVSTTKAAQEFIRLSGGQSSFGETRFNSAVSLNVLG